MKLKDLIRTDPITTPDRIFLYGIEGVGKSTFASEADRPLFLAAEDGLKYIPGVARLDEPRAWEDVLNVLDIACSDANTTDYGTLVIDTINWLEPLAVDWVCQDNEWVNIEEPGWGKGFIALAEEYRKMIRRLVEIRRRGLEIIIIGHSEVKSFAAPDSEPYSRFQPAISRQGGAFIKRWCDAVLFTRHEEFTKKEAQTKRIRGYSTGRRIMHTVWNAAYDAKNRMGLPETMPLSYEAFDEARRSEGPEVVAALQQQIGDLMGSLGPMLSDEEAEKAEAFVKEAGTARLKLAQRVDWLRDKIEEKLEEVDDDGNEGD